MKRIKLLSLMLILMLLMQQQVFATSSQPQKAYLMSYFGGQNYSESLHLAYSYDGRNWLALNNNRPVFTPTVDTGRLRDPYIYRKPTGGFVVLGTVGATTGQETIMVYDSQDLVTYTNGRIIRMNDQGWHAWAPEVFYDQPNNRYGIIWSGNSGYNKTYVNYTTDFINVTAPQVFFDPGYDQIDAHIVKEGSTYYLFYKDERITGKAIQVAKSSTGTAGSFVTYTGFITPKWTEGPFIIKDPSNKFLMYADYFTQGGYFGLWEADSLDQTSWTTTNNYLLPKGIRHANTIEISIAELNTLINAFGATHYSVFNSYNYPNTYIRHAYSQLKISEKDLVTGDFQWKIKPGLANSNLVSLESVNFEGYYVRHKNGKLYIEQNDGSQLFKNDATFYMDSGLANSNYVSFRSYNYPTKYIRHKGGFLEINTNDGSDLFKQDATFKKISY